MGAPVGAVETGQLVAVNENGNGTISVTTNVDLDDSVDRLVPGEFTDSVGVWPILGSTAGQNFVVTIEKVHGETLPSVNDAFEAADDDVIPGDVPDPVTTVMVEKFAPAYVLPVFDGGGDSNGDDPDAPFALNLADNIEDQGLEDQAVLSRDSTSTSLFWTLHSLGCFQGPQSEDRDPQTEQSCPQGYSNGKTAFVFSEQQRELGYTQDGLKAHILVHEVGHSFGLEDEYGWEPPPYPADPNYDGVMYWVWKGVFTDGNVVAIRSIDCPSALFFSEY